MSTAPASGSFDELHQALENYNWDDDVEFQSGLSAILGSNSTPEQATELTLRARCFYYARKYNTPVDFDTYKSYRTSHPSQTRPINPNPEPTNGLQSLQSHPTSSSEPEAGGILPTASANEPPAPYPTSFAHIVNLVTTGQPIPGIKEIPSTVLTGQGTQAVASKRKKPWEKDEQVAGEAATS